MGSVAWDVRTGEIVYCIPKTGRGEVYEKDIGTLFLRTTRTIQNLLGQAVMVRN